MDAFLHFWQHLPSKMSPEIFSIGSFRLQYYGLMYILAFLVTYFLARHRLRAESRTFPYTDDFLKDILTAAFIGVLLGGRLGYVLFYNFDYYLNHPLEIIMPFSFEGGFHFTGISGMSYHGGLIGVMVACALFVKRRKANYWKLSDLFFPAAPLGFTFGRIGNFINGELWGRITDAPIGMYFPRAPTPDLRHPSQLYEAFFEGIVLFLILWALRKRRLPEGSMAAFYIFGYGFFRFFIEFYRQPDSHLGFVLLNRFTMGQVLCGAMMLVGVLLFLYLARRQKRRDAEALAASRSAPSSQPTPPAKSAPTSGRP